MKKMLEYQKLEIELIKLKKSGVSNVDQSNMVKLKNYIKETQDKGIKLESDAKALLDDYSKLKNQYDTNFDKVQKLINTDMSTIALDDVDTILSKINALSSELFLLERNINIIINKIKSSLKDFETTKNNIIKAKQKYNQFKTKCEADIQAVMPKVKEIEAKLKELEPSLDKDLFAKYKSSKADKIFPVFVPFANGHCSGCRVEIPTATANKLKAEGKIICEQCHRVIYNQ